MSQSAPKTSYLTNLVQLMKSGLFWRFFFAFWLSTTVLIILNLLLIFKQHDNLDFRPVPAPLMVEIEGLSHEVLRVLSRSGSGSKRLRQEGLRQDGLRHDSSSLHQDSPVMRKRLESVFLLNDKSQDYFGKKVPQALADLHSRSVRQGESFSVLFQGQLFLGGKPITVDDQSWYLYFKRGDKGLSRQLIGDFFSRFAQSLLVSIFLLSFPFSLILAWLITRPIKRLQRASRALKHDLTERQILHAMAEGKDEFGELAQEIIQMADHLQKASSAQKQLLSDVSHELRSPLARLNIALALLEKKTSPSEQDLLQRLYTESERMNLMLSHLLNLSRIESTAGRLQRKTLDLSQLVRQVMADAQFEADQQGVLVELLLPETCPYQGDPGLLTSALENIIRNAIRYAQKNPQAPRVKVEMIQQDQKIKLEISDNGCGVEPYHLEKLFEPFYRAHSDRSRDSGGVGLGLSIAQRALMAHHAEIKAQPVVPQGLAIVIDFPQIPA